MIAISSFILMSTFAVAVSATSSIELGVPKLNLDFWNKDSTIQWNNNCYNYSTNRVTNSYAQPGEASHQVYNHLTCEDVARAASKDLGLTRIFYSEFKNKNDVTLIALVVAPDYDFHWYRRDANNLWSHKPGGGAATTKDQSDALIASPETADRGVYTDFCGYFKINNYLKDESEQNAGRVRIGNMLELPDSGDNSASTSESQAPSEVEILIHSGRKNPRLLFDVLLQNQELALVIKSLSQQLQQANVRELAPYHLPSRLGYNGILIRDHQGLLFSKGTTVYIKGNSILASSSGRSVKLVDDQILKLEQQLKAYF